MACSLESERLVFRKVVYEDIGFVQDYLSDEERARYLPLQRAYSEQEAEHWLEKRIRHWKRKGFGIYLLSERSSTTGVIGYCGLEYVMDSHFVEISYGLIQRFWGKGYASEAALYITNYGLETLNLGAIYGAAVPENVVSIEIMKKCGMTENHSFNLYGNTVKSFSTAGSVTPVR